MIFKRKSRRADREAENLLHNINSQYSNAIEFFEGMLKGQPDDKKITLLDHSMEIVRNDLKFGLLSDIFYLNAAPDFRVAVLFELGRNQSNKIKY